MTIILFGLILILYINIFFLIYFCDKMLNLTYIDWEKAVCILFNFPEDEGKKIQKH